MDIIYSFIGIYLDVMLLYFLTRQFETDTKKAVEMLCYVAYGVSIYFLNDLGVSVYIKTPLNITTILIMFYLLYGNLGRIQSIKFAILYFISLSIPELLITTVVFFINDYSLSDLYQNTPLWFVCLMLSKIVTFILIVIIVKVKRISKGREHSTYRSTLLGFAPLLMTLAILIYDMYIFTNLRGFNEETLIFIIVTITIALIIYTFSHIILFDIYNEYKEAERELNILESKNLMQYNFYKQKLEAELEIRKMYHDLKNNMLILKKAALNSECYDKILDSMQKMGDFIDTGNEMLNIMLFEKMRITEENNIDFKIMVDYFNCNILSDIEICTLFGNLIDNAIEACCRMTSSNEKYISIKTKVIDNKLIIQILNSIDKLPIVGNEYQSFVTSKSDKKMHGIGLKSIRGIVEEHNGNMDINYTKKEFCVSILFYTK